jgi:PhzF family phenazine biosynthesis protein
MQRIATWNNLAETTFLLPPTQAGADYRVRIFTTRQEIAFAGHPTIGSAHVRARRRAGAPRKRELVQECQAGLLAVRCEARARRRRRLHSVRVPRSRVVPHDDAATVLLDRALARSSAARWPRPASKAAAAGGWPSWPTKPPCAP